MTSPNPGTETTRSSPRLNDGTISSVTEVAWPSVTATFATTSPAGTSSRIVVTGSTTGTMPVSTSTVATPIVPWPHIGSSPETSMNSTPQSASGRVGGCRIAPLIEPCPRGSHISSVRRSSAFSMNHSRRSAMLAPGITPNPPVITRVGMPSVCESTAEKTRLALTPLSARSTPSTRRGSVPRPSRSSAGSRPAGKPWNATGRRNRLIAAVPTEVVDGAVVAGYGPPCCWA